MLVAKPKNNYRKTSKTTPTIATRVLEEVQSAVIRSQSCAKKKNFRKMSSKKGLIALKNRTDGTGYDRSQDMLIERGGSWEKIQMLLSILLV